MLCIKKMAACALSIVVLLTNSTPFSNLTTASAEDVPIVPSIIPNDTFPADFTVLDQYSEADNNWKERTYGKWENAFKNLSDRRLTPLEKIPDDFVYFSSKEEMAAFYPIESIYNYNSFMKKRQNVSFIAHDDDGSEIKVDLQDYHVIDHSCELNLAEIREDQNIFEYFYIDPVMNGYTSEDPLVIYLSNPSICGSSTGCYSFLVNNTSYYMIDQGKIDYTQPDSLSSLGLYAGRSDVVFFFESDFGANKFEILNTGMYSGYTRTTEEKYLIKGGLYEEDTYGTRTVSASELHPVSNPYYPDQKEWETLPDDQKYKYEYVPNAVIYGEKKNEFHFQNGATFVASVIMPESALDIWGSFQTALINSTYRDANLSLTHGIDSDVLSFWGSLLVQHLNIHSINIKIGISDCYRNGKSIRSDILDEGSWSLDEYGLLQINGEGLLSSLENLRQLIEDDVQYIEIGGGFTEIADNAFANWTKVKSIYMPDSMYQVGEKAFLNCQNMKAFYIPKLLHYFKRNSFEGCTNLDVFIGDYRGSTLVSSLSELIISSEDDRPLEWEKIGTNSCYYDEELLSYLDELALKKSYMTEIVTAVSTTKLDTTTSTTASTTVSTTSKVKTTATTLSTSSKTSTTAKTTQSTSTTPKTTTTTTTTSTVTTMTTTTVTTTETTTTTTQAFLFDSDTWNFINSRKNFGSSYYISDQDYQEMKEKLSDTELEEIETEMNKTWTGSCYGMSVSALLNFYDVWSPDRFQKDADFLRELKLNDNTKSMINYYQMLQYTSAATQEFIAFQRQKEKDKWDYIVSELKAGHPVLILYSYMDEAGNTKGHAVIAYKIENSSLSFRDSQGNFEKFDQHIWVYDPNYDNRENPADEKYDFYLMKDSGNWCIPNAEKMDEYAKLAIMPFSYQKGGVISFATSNVEFLNHLGLLHNTNDFEHSGADFSTLDINGPSSGTKVKSEENSNTGYHDFNDEDNIQLFSNFFEDEEEQKEILQYSMYSDFDYLVSHSNGKPFDLSMRRPNSILKADLEESGDVRFCVNDAIKCQDVSGKFNVSIAADKGFHPTDWYSISISGNNSGDLTLTPCMDKEQEGWILEGEYLNQVHVSVKNREDSFDAAFSTSAQKVLIYEIDSNTVGVKADLDKDGSFETVISRSVVPMAGDLNADKTLQMNDAVLLARFLAEDKDESIFYATENSDVDGNSIVDLMDLRLLLQKIIEK